MERGVNQTVPRLDIVVYPTVSVFPVVAVGTAPYLFASRAVTSMPLTINNFDMRAQLWKVSWFCTPDKSKAWLVFG